ncbi:MAG: polysaccharide pyruvyl transferase CsaB [Cyanobacterium sp. T60_A2020_053]|nr:polysaccharide pyruvyl transferase CsaB [Cyanobacterium sp. T60_A2020_053]
MRKAIICGYYGRGNAGDEALLLALLERLPAPLTPIILSGNPSLTTKNYGVKSYSRQQIIQEIWHGKKDDYFIWGGGSLMQDATSWRSPIFYGGLMKLAQLKGLITIAYAQGIGPLNSPFTRWLTKDVLSKCHGVSVRDQASARLLEQWHIPHFSAPDPVWALSAKLNKSLKLPSSPHIGVNLRSHISLTETKLNTIIDALITLQKNTNANIILIPFQPQNDLILCQKVAEKLQGKNEIIQLDNPQELKGIFREIKMLIGMRLHSIIMGASEGCNCFALSYDPKVSQLMTELHIPGIELTAMGADAHTLAQQWLNLYTQGEGMGAQKREELKTSALLHEKLFD